MRVNFFETFDRVTAMTRPQDSGGGLLGHKDVIFYKHSLSLVHPKYGPRLVAKGVCSSQFMASLLCNTDYIGKGHPHKVPALQLMGPGGSRPFHVREHEH